MRRGDRRARDARVGRVARRHQRPTGELLETRDLPSLLSLFDQSPPPANPIPRSALKSFQPTGRRDGLYQLSLGSHPPYQGTVDGQAIKAPMFNTAYHGPRRMDLDVTAASVQLNPSRGYSLTGKVLGPIQVSEPAEYLFLINRGGARSPGFLNIRPGILYDAEVAVATGPDGPEGTVALLDRQGQEVSSVTLPPEAVRIKGATVRISVPAGLLPATQPSRPNATPGRYTYAFAAGLPGSTSSDIASFVPEYVPAVVQVSVGQRHQAPRGRAGQAQGVGAAA
ncbi:MAG: hypothetical protein U0790_10845 [Isosphaeraceae bacterium]